MRLSRPSLEIKNSFRDALIKFTDVLKRNWKGGVVIFIATLIFFLPILNKLDSYSEGGDAMFNAWTLSRNHQCILRNDCPTYTDANIYFPHKDTMLYSETQLSAGLLTLPAHLINKNPIFAYNVWTILSFLFAGWFMYLLAKYLSKGNEIVSILSGLIYEFAPIKLAAIFHLQSLSIFYLPLIFLLIFKFFKTRKNSYLIWLFVILVLQFYASWYQMVFVLLSLAAFLAVCLLFRLYRLRQIILVSAAVGVAVIATLPLAKEYIRFSKANNATFNVRDQIKYSASLNDYLMPYSGSIFGKAYYQLNPEVKRNSYNPDSFSYHGITIYIIALLIFLFAIRQRIRHRGSSSNLGIISAFLFMAFAGFIVSLGPVLKLGDQYLFKGIIEGLDTVIPLPFQIVNIILPQLSFIRALGRASILTLFALCCILALGARYLNSFGLKPRTLSLITIGAAFIVALDILPVHQIPMVSQSYSYNLAVPEVYKYIQKRDEIKNIIILATDADYPGATIPFARAEQVLWSGYHNKNIYNGYSGYTPPSYFADYGDYLDFDGEDVGQLDELGIQYVLVDKTLSLSNINFKDTVKQHLPDVIYEDERYVLHRL